MSKRTELSGSFLRLYNAPLYKEGNASTVHNPIGSPQPLAFIHIVVLNILNYI